jgi:hypothetical protein
MNDEKRTREVLDKVLASSEPRPSTGEPYVLVNVLHALVKPEQWRFAHLLPWLEEWRDVLASGGAESHS